MRNDLKTFAVRLLTSLGICLLAFSAALAQRPPQYQISGPTNVTAGTVYTYTLVPPSTAELTWNVTCGRIVSVDQRFDRVEIIFDGACRNPIIAVSEGWTLLATLTVNSSTVPAILNPGTITTSPQLVRNTTIPATLLATPASGGNCAGAYLYQWQYSYDNTTFFDAEDAILDSFPFETPIDQTVYFRRKVTCGSSEEFTGSVAVTFMPPLNPGTITSPIQTIPINTVPGVITATTATNSLCATYLYQWEVSFDGVTFAPISGATAANLTYPTILAQQAYFRRMVKCKFESAYTNIAIVKVKAPVTPPVTPPRNAIDSLLQAAGININAVFGIANDSIANGRGNPNDSLAFVDTTAEIMQLLSEISNQYGAPDSSELAEIAATPIQDSVETLLAAGSEGAPGNDSAVVFIPMVDDNLIQLYRSTGNYKTLDSLTQAPVEISLEEASRTLEDTSSTIANRPGPGFIPIIIPTFSVLNMNRGAIINGSSLVNRLQVFRYTGTFYFPLGTPSSVRWVVSGGIIMGQNTNPAAGPIYVDIRWTSSFGSPYVALFDLPSLQFNTLPVYFVPVAARVYPATQEVYYGQVPCILQSTSGCNSMNGFTYQYQWQQLDVYSSNNWTDITGATTMNYQPPALSNGWMMYRCITRVYNSLGGLATTCVTSAASIKLRPVFPGAINATVTHVQYNTVPAITQTAATGGFTPPGYVYSYTWQYSVNDGPWQTAGTGQVYPNFAIQSTNTRIRRVVTITNVNTGNLPQTLWTATSNIINFTTFYQTVDYENRNYIRENIVNVRGVSAWEDADMLTAEKKTTTTTYLDGLGRPIQVVGKGTHFDEATSQWYDFVSPIIYEAGGRMDKKLLPYATTDNFGKFKTNISTAQPAFYQSKFNEQHAYARMEYDNSPANRMLKSYGPGSGWGGINISISGDIEPYNSNDGVRVFSIGYNATDLPVNNNGLIVLYQSLQLIKSVLKDEKNKKTITYITRDGREILKKVQLADDGPGLTQQHQGWLCTYYVYDDFNQLRYIISPKGVKELEANGWVMTQQIADELCTSYQYDERGRAIAKKMPGKGIEYTVYDKRSRPVYTQDANMRAKSPAEWLVNFYDELDRPVMTGIYKSNQSRDALQTLAEAAAGPGTYTITTGGIIKVWGCPLTAADINNTAVFTTLTFSYYDEYNFSGKKNFINNQAMAYDGGNAESRNLTKRTLGMPTGGKTRVMDDNPTPRYLDLTMYYDEEGRVMQDLVDNIKGGVDITDVQYHFDGRIISSLETHNAPGTPFTNFQVLTKYKFNKTGSTVGISKKINNTTRSMVASTSLPGSNEDADAGYKQIVSYKFNELGKNINKVLSPGYNNGAGLESLDFDYNLRGWLTGINKNYALGEFTSNQWEHFFGMYIGYENRDGKFAAAQYNGSITGVQWKSQGDNTPRKFNYTYDNTNRLTAADFTQRGNSGESWNATRADFSTKAISYDENGNLLTLTNMGILPGATAPVTLDQLTYFYKIRSNKLAYVTDNGAGGTANGKLGDFKDGANAAGTDDYVYDENGNITGDLNKAIQNGSAAGITYNYLDKPLQINVQGKGIVKYVYDATGNKMQKIYTESPSAANGNQQVVTTTTYIGMYVYQQVTAGSTVQPEALQMIMHEEGRIRLITPYNNPSDPANFNGGGMDLPGGKQGVFDYFIKDHLGNIRATITEEINKASGVATMEDANAAVKQQEEAVFGNPGAANEVNTTRWPRPTEWTSGTQPPLTLAQNQKVSRLQASGGVPKTGPNALLRVMAGDKIRAKVDYYYVQNPGIGGGGQGLTTLVTGLSAALSNGRATALAQDKVAGIGSTLTGSPSLINFFSSAPTAPVTPKAYLNYVFFDEQFNFVAEVSGFQRVTTAGNGAAPLVLTEAKAVKNGYVYVYVSNESAEPVYFDNFTVSHERGQLLTDDHYYAFGLRIAAISSRSVSTSLRKDAIKLGYQGVFAEEIEEAELNYNEYGLRNYDPQIGRWTGVDPYDEFPSPYTGMGNDPVNNVDPSGGSVFSAIWAFFGGGGAGAGCMSTAGMCGYGYVAPSTASAFVTATRVALTSIAIGGAAFTHMQWVDVRAIVKSTSEFIYNALDKAPNTSFEQLEKFALGAAAPETYSHLKGAFGEGVFAHELHKYMHTGPTSFKKRPTKGAVDRPGRYCLEYQTNRADVVLTIAVGEEMRGRGISRTLYIASMWMQFHLADGTAYPEYWIQAQPTKKVTFLFEVKTWQVNDPGDDAAKKKNVNFLITYLAAQVLEFTIKAAREKLTNVGAETIPVLVFDKQSWLNMYKVNPTAMAAIHATLVAAGGRLKLIEGLHNSANSKLFEIVNKIRKKYGLPPK